MISNTIRAARHALDTQMPTLDPTQSKLKRRGWNVFLNESARIEYFIDEHADGRLHESVRVQVQNYENKISLTFVNDCIEHVSVGAEKLEAPAVKRNLNHIKTIMASIRAAYIYASEL